MRFSSLVSARPQSNATMNELLKFAPDDENVPISTGRLKGIEYDIAVTGRPDAVRKEIAFTVRLQRLSSGGLDDNDDNTQVRSHSLWTSDLAVLHQCLQAAPSS